VKVLDSTKNEEIEYKLVTSEGIGWRHQQDIDDVSHWPGTAEQEGRRVGIVSLRIGNRELEVLSLSTIHDQAAAE